MSYRLSSKKRQQRKNLWLRSIVALVLLGVFVVIFNLLGGTFSWVSSGLVSGTSGVGNMFGVLTSDKQKLIDENTRLTQELARQSADRQMQDALVARNNDLLAELGRQTISVKTAAGVVNKPPFSPYDTYTLDAGSDFGVSVGDVVSFSDYVVLGKITRVTESGSKASLFSAPRIETPVNINGTTFIAVGQGGGTMRVDVPRDFEVEEGHMMLLPGISVWVVGELHDVQFRPQDSFKKLFFKTPVNIEAVEVVSIVPFSNLDEVYEAPTVSDTE